MKIKNVETAGLEDSVDGVINKDVFNNLLDILVQKKKKTVKRNKIGNREYLSLPKETLQVSDEF